MYSELANKKVEQALVRRLAVSLDVDVRDQPRGMAHKP